MQFQILSLFLHNRNSTYLIVKLEKFININWFMQRRPYHSHSAYDICFLELCRQVYGIIQKYVNKHVSNVDLDEDDCRDLAYVVTGYFEDVAGGIGFWESLVRLNRNLYGKRVPFIPKEVIEKDEALSSDIHFTDIYYLLFVNYIALLNAHDERKALVFLIKISSMN